MRALIPLLFAAAACYEPQPVRVSPRSVLDPPPVVVSNLPPPSAPSRAACVVMSDGHYEYCTFQDGHAESCSIYGGVRTCQIVAR